MTRTYRSWPALILIVALVAGCSTMRGFLNPDPRPGFDQRYNQLINQQPPAATRDADLLQLAREANAKAGSAGEAQDKVNYYARAATYAWAANTEEARARVILNADAGNSLCKSFPADQFKPARDCALLAAYGPVAAAESALDEIDRSKPASPTTTVVNLDSLTAIDGQAERFEGIVVRQWPTVDGVMAAPGVPADTVGWFGESKRRQWCRFYLITNQAKRWKVDPSTRAASLEVRTRIAKHSDTVFNAGKQPFGVSSRSAALNMCRPYAEPSQPSIPALAS